jgi:hypothetical protein
MALTWDLCPPIDLKGYPKSIPCKRLQSIAKPDVKLLNEGKPKNLKFVPKSSTDVKTKHTEKSIQKALLWYFDWAVNECYTGITFGGGIADFIRITKARYVAEVEVKISLSDWHADQHKDKWKSKERKKVCQFYYAVPTFLIPKIPAWVADTVGILEITEHGQVIEIRPAARVGKYKLKVADYISLHRALYFRYAELKANIG